MLRIFVCTFALLSSIVAFAQGQSSSSPPTDTINISRVVVYETTERETYKEQPVFSGCSVGFDAAGAVMANVAKWGQYEAQVRVNFKQRFYPIAELGVGICDHTNGTTNLNYQTHSPYFRIGCDVNFHKNPASRNRIFAGVRYGFSRFKYDMFGDDIVDDYWGGSMPFNVNGKDGKQHWAEFVFGLEGRVWKFIHLGWSWRYKFRLAQGKTPYGAPFYVPGYGKNGGHCMGGSFNVVFDVNVKKKSNKR